MLVLSRKPEEAVIIGNNIVVQVLESRGGQIRLGITAPREITVHREEIYARVYGKTAPVLEYKQKQEVEDNTR